MGKNSKSEPNPVVAERKRIMKRIRKLSRRVIRLKTKYNELTLISCLPPELLLRIFFAPQSNFHKDSVATYYKWTVVTHISRSWCALALETKQLWSGVSVTTEEIQSPWADLSVKRSVPLRLDVAVIVKRRVFIPAVFDDVHRIRTLRIDITGSSNEDDRRLKPLIKWLRTTEAPVLDEFILLGSGKLERRGPRQQVNHAPFSGSLFNSVAPCLRSLQVKTFDLSLNFVPFQGITTLILHQPHGHPGILSLPALLRFLSITHLHTLDVIHVLYDEDDHDKVDDAKPIPLSSLLSLALYLPTHQCQRLLRHIVVPPSCRAEIWGHSTRKPDDPLAISPHAFMDSILSNFSSDATVFTGEMEVKVETDVIAFGLRRNV
ncbi:hypothetical protein BDN72DRAFT_850548 [Pluteus cervinus]|uniref:Uncharacterized protein n=1 Tax=Pluteus cervinus TaxID=181527 RepID=A0ACD3A414_9AGAR|nr:hypothetical protein BDN72DRAFT_850548 [Pluteus cervinus]